jgi:hypothetical protein
MKFVIQFFAILASAFIVQLFLPWYSLAVAAFVMGYVFKSKANFLAGFLAIAILWFLKAWWADAHTASDLSGRVAMILMVKSKLILMLVTALIGGLVGGFATLTGAILKYKRKMQWY